MHKPIHMGETSFTRHLGQAHLAESCGSCPSNEDTSPETLPSQGDSLIPAPLPAPSLPLQWLLGQGVWIKWPERGWELCFPPGGAARLQGGMRDAVGARGSVADSVPVPLPRTVWSEHGGSKQPLHQTLGRMGAAARLSPCWGNWFKTSS